MSTTNEMKIHPFAEVFPETSPEDYQALKTSINRNGQRDPIVLLGGEVLDGRTRYRATRELKIPPQFRQYDPVKDGPDPLAWVIDKNLHRRHLTTGQKAALALSLEKVIAQAKEQAKAAAKPPTSNDPDASDDDDIPIGTKEPEGTVDGGKTPTSIQQAAKAAGVSERSVADAKFLEKNDPERLESVKKGETSLHAATQAAKADQEKQATEPDLLKGNTNVVNQYRNECADLMAASHGDKFAEAVRNDTILRDKELREFMKLAIQDQAQNTALVARGWKTREAVKFAKGIFEKDDPIRDLLNLAIMRGGRATTKLDGHRIMIFSEPALAMPELKPVKDLFDSIAEQQAKPETKKDMGTLAEAFKQAEDKPGKQKPAPTGEPGNTSAADKPGKPAKDAKAKPSAPARSSAASKGKTPGRAAKSGSAPKAAKKTAKK